MQVARIDVDVLKLERGQQHNLLLRHFSNLFWRCSGDGLAFFNSTDLNTARTSCWNVAGTGPGKERYYNFLSP